MTLPLSRNKTYADGDPVRPADLNDFQDQFIALQFGGGVNLGPLAAATAIISGALSAASAVIAGALSAASAAIAGAITGASVSVTGNVTVGDDLVVGGDATITGQVTAGSAEVSGNLVCEDLIVAETVQFGAVYIVTKSGTPEGSYAAPPGSLCLRTDGGAGATLYIKESGTGNTGWVAK